MNQNYSERKNQFTFIHGGIGAQKIVDEIQQYQFETQTGAYSLFLGQVRSDKIKDKKVQAIEYSAYETMVLNRFEKISQQLFDTYDIFRIKVLHSLDTVPSGEISLMVLVTAGHRIAAMKTCQEAVDLIKSELPIWGKELFDDGGHVWKENN